MRRDPDRDEAERRAWEDREAEMQAEALMWDDRDEGQL